MGAGLSRLEVQAEGESGAAALREWRRQRKVGAWLRGGMEGAGPRRVMEAQGLEAGLQQV